MKFRTYLGDDVEVLESLGSVVRTDKGLYHKTKIFVYGVSFLSGHSIDELEMGGYLLVRNRDTGVLSLVSIP